MSKYEVLITEQAREDLRELIEQFINVRKNESLTERLLADLNKVQDDLTLRPFSYALVNDEKLVTAGIRKLWIENYVFFFIASEKEKTVSLMRILLAQRSWADLL